CQGCAESRCVHSFPTRRSSDLDSCSVKSWGEVPQGDGIARHLEKLPLIAAFQSCLGGGVCPVHPGIQRPGFIRAPQFRGARHQRSEEHTSELQSRENLVCRLLL